MKTIKIELYNLEELEESAQQKAYEDHMRYFEYFGHDDNVASLNAFCDLFNIEVTKFEYGSQNFIDAEYSDTRILSGTENWYYQPEMEGVRFWKFLNNNDVLPDLSGNCPFTGVWIDEELLDPLREFIKRPNLHQEWGELLRECLECWIQACRVDYECAISVEMFIESSQVNEWTYEANGAFRL